MWDYGDHHLALLDPVINQTPRGEGQEKERTTHRRGKRAGNVRGCKHKHFRKVLRLIENLRRVSMATQIDFANKT